MKRFVKNIILFFCPLIVVFGLNEYFLRNIPNNYAYKNQWMQENAKSIKILNLGSSHAYFGIDPNSFEYSAFNLAHVSQDLKYDYFLFDKYKHSLDSLKVLILPISYHTFCSKGLEYGQEKWRVRNYTIYYHCPYHKWEADYCFESMTFTGLRSVRAAFGKEDHLGCGVLGGCLQNEPRPIDYDSDESGKTAALRHTNLKYTDELIEQNRTYVVEMIEWSQLHNVKVILLTTPTSKVYRKYINKEQWKRTQRECEELATKYSNVEYWCYFDSSLFIDEDFQDEDHLSGKGAFKFTEIINNRLASIIK